MQSYFEIIIALLQTFFFPSDHDAGGQWAAGFARPLFPIHG